MNSYRKMQKQEKEPVKQNKTSISKKSSYQEIGEFWDNNDLSEFWEQTKAVEFEVEIEAQQIHYYVSGKPKMIVLRENVSE